METPGFFVALFFDEGNTHITLMIRKHCLVAELQTMVNHLKTTIAPMLPLTISVDPSIQMKGVEMDVHFSDFGAWIQLSKLYNEMIDADSPFQIWSPHVTVDSDEKKKTIDTILERTGGMAVLKSAKLKQLGFKDTLFEVSLKSH